VRPFIAHLSVIAALVGAPGCYSLPYVDPGPRWIDQFNNDGGALAPPSWAVFDTWTCGTRPTPKTGSGADGGVTGSISAPAQAADAAIPDGGNDGGVRVTCQAGQGLLEQPFAFDASSNDVEYTVETHTSSGSVDFTGFPQFVFNAKLAAPLTAPLPGGTVFEVELDCTKNLNDPAVTQDVPDITNHINAQGLILSRLYLSQFQSTVTSSNGPCLSQIDGIRFVITPGQNDLPAVTGTFSLDDVSLQD
jgi:hypothetical protein